MNQTPATARDKSTAIDSGSPFSRSVPENTKRKGITNNVQPKAILVSFQEQTESLLALKQKKVDALVTDDVLIQWMAKQNPDLVIVGKLYTVEPYGMGVRHNDSKWRNAVNEAFLDIWDSRRYHELYKKWFGQEPEFEIPWYPK